MDSQRRGFPPVFFEWLIISGQFRMGGQKTHITASICMICCTSEDACEIVGLLVLEYFCLNCRQRGSGPYIDSSCSSSFVSSFRDVLMGGGYVCMFQKPFLGCINPHICKFNCFVLIFLSSGHPKIQPRTPISSALFSKTHSFELGELSAYRCDSARCYSSSLSADASHKQ